MGNAGSSNAIILLFAALGLLLTNTLIRHETTDWPPSPKGAERSRLDSTPKSHAINEMRVPIQKEHLVASAASVWLQTQDSDAQSQDEAARPAPRRIDPLSSD